MKAIDGRAVAAALGADTATVIRALRQAGTVPTLAIVVPTRDEATAWYVGALGRAARGAGVTCRVDDLADVTERKITVRLDELSADPGVHGVICQTPLPDGVSLAAVGEHIAPHKDVDGTNPTSLGRLAAGLPAFAPATASAVLEILRHTGVRLAGAHVVVVGRSTVVGKPTALLLTAEDATVTLCHSQTVDLAARCAQADVLVVAVGRPGTVGAAHVKPGAVVIDVGTNPTADGRLVGDVAADELTTVDGALTPVPGGVGPVTTALLLRNTVVTASRATS